VPVVELITPDAWRTQPWANGAGVTHEIARWGGDAFDARISVAELVARCPFSRFAGYDRWLAAGGDVTLVLPDGPHALRHGEALAFAGELDVVGDLAGPTWDLNVMVRRGVAWSAEIVRGRTEWTAAAGVTALFALGDGAAVVVAGQRVRLAARATLLATSSAEFAVGVEADGPVARVHFDLRARS
jgi:environmental stress-induced protein Ves